MSTTGAGTLTIRAATDADSGAIQEIWRPETRWLGSFGLAWSRSWEGGETRHHWDVCIERVGGEDTYVGFAHWYQRRDGNKTLYEIAVHRGARRKGVARALIAHIGTPLTLKTDHDNTESNPFYASLGFVRMGSVLSRSGKRTLNIYAKYE